MVTIGPLSEHELIAACFAPLAAPGGFGLLDDAAVLTPSPGCDLVVTVDAVVAGVHFPEGAGPREVASKALGVNISDLAAKGAEPKGFLLTLGMGGEWTPDWVSGFAEALGADMKAWRCPLLGGDTVRANGAPFVSITAFGEVPGGKMVRRHGARPGDILCVSGTIGDAALGLPLVVGPEPGWAKALDEGGRALLRSRYHFPTPRLALAPIVQKYAHAAMDVSDGLIGDLEKLLKASSVSARLDLDKVPMSAPARKVLACDEGILETIVTGGDDYEILCAVPAAERAAAQRDAEEAGVVLTAIGTVMPAGQPPEYRRHGVARHFARGAFSHF